MAEPLTKNFRFSYPMIRKQTDFFIGKKSYFPIFTRVYGQGFPTAFRGCIFKKTDFQKGTQMIVVIPLFVPALQFSANATKCNVAPKKVLPTPLPKKTLVCSHEIKGLFSSQYIKQAPADLSVKILALYGFIVPHLRNRVHRFRAKEKPSILWYNGVGEIECLTL